MWRLFRARRSLRLDLLSSEQFLLQLRKSAPQNVCLHLVGGITKAEIPLCVGVDQSLQIPYFRPQGFTELGLPIVHVIAPGRTLAD